MDSSTVFQGSADHRNRQPLRVTIATLFYWPEKTGIGPPIQLLAESLVQAGARVKVLTPRPSYPEMAVFASYRDGSSDQEVRNGVAIERFYVAPQKRNGGAISRLVTELGFAWGIWWRLIKSPTADLYVAACPSILAVGALILASRKNSQRIAIVYDIQSGLAKSLNLTSTSFIVKGVEWLERTFFNAMDRLVTLTPAMAETLTSIGVTRPILIIPPTIDDQLIQPLPEPTGPIRLLYSGNLGRKQGLEQLIDLAAELQRRGNEATLIIRGDGNHSAALQLRAATQSLSNLRFEPLCPAEGLAEGLAEGHIHLVPQNPAGAAFAVPSKIYSIMAAGRPFICTAEPGSPLDRLREQSDAFLICPPNRPEQLADAIERLMANPAVRARLGRNGRAYVEQHAGRAAAGRAYRDLLTGASGLVTTNCRDIT